MPIFVQPSPQSPLLGYRAMLANGEAGTAQTIALMRQLIDQALTDPSFIRKASDIVSAAPAYDSIGEAQTIYSWVKSNIRFTMDPVSKEKLYPPAELLKIRAGDCDDISMLTAALLMAVGYPARLITISADASQPQNFSHVYVEAEIPPGSGNWIPIDAARPDSQFGVGPPVWYRKRAWSLTDNSYSDLSGTKYFIHANTVHVHQASKPLSGLGAYYAGGLGQDADPGDILSTILEATPGIISAATGNPPPSAYPATPPPSTGPFAAQGVTPYTPGAGVPAGGYARGAAPRAGGGTDWSGWLSKNWIWLAAGILLWKQL
jgi:hypothetical protein